MKHLKLVNCLLILAVVLVSGCSKFGGMSDDEAREVTSKRLKQLALAAKRYAANNKDIMPDLSSPAAAQAALKSGLNQDPVGGEEIFKHPVTNEDFVPNPNLSKVDEMSIENAWDVPLFWEASPSNDTRAVIFEDGTFKRLAESDWTRIKTTNKIP